MEVVPSTVADKSRPGAVDGSPDDGQPSASTGIVDDRGAIQPDDRVLLIVDNDLGFASFVLDAAHTVGFKGLVTPLGAAALAMARDYQPQAILLDISLPDIDGWRVLKRLKNDLAIRHIPVSVVSTVDRPERGLRIGAQAVLPKPIQTTEQLERFLVGIRRFIERTERTILIVEPDARRRKDASNLLGGPDVRVIAVESGGDALEAIHQRDIDCVVVSPILPDMTAAALSEQLAARPDHESCPIVLYLGPEAVPGDLQRWTPLANEFGLKIADSTSRLVDQAAMLLCRPMASLTDPARQMIHDLYDPASVMAGKKVLIVDDDIRNIFALTSILERYDMITVSAETGRDAINLLHAAPDVDIVLMDIMMPEMDGIDTMRAIRQLSQFRELPIVAVTAKAMKGDREKCIEAGAWDYLSKPVDTDQMLSVLRAWLAV